MERRAWTRPELLKVLSLYCQMPFGQMHARNRAVLQLSREITRTPSAIALKLVNFASLDPELRERGVGGMPNTSRADRTIWEEFYGRWQQLADAHVLALEASGRDDELVGTETRRARRSDSTEVTRSVRTRLGQQFFRNAVLAAYDWKCCVTDIAAPELLRASHISPWAGNAEHRLNPRNGLCFNALHDAAFDRGLITIGEQFQLLVAARLKDEMPQPLYETAFGRHAGRPIRLPERFRPDAAFLHKHRDAVYIG